MGHGNRVGLKLLLQLTHPTELYAKKTYD